MSEFGPPAKADFVPARSSLPVRPLPPNSERIALMTERLIIRPLVPEDLAPLHELRRQPEVMINTGQGRVDKDLAETQTKLDPYLPPGDGKTYNFAICLRETGEFIGIGGCHRLEAEFGWPTVGYMLNSRFWGKGLATEFLRNWLVLWTALPREPAELRVDKRTLPEGDAPLLERLTALTVGYNIASQKILKKCGFEQFATYREADLRNPAEDVELLGFRYSPPQQ